MLLRLGLLALCSALVGCAGADSTPIRVVTPAQLPIQSATERADVPDPNAPPTPAPFNLATPAIVIEHIGEAIIPTLIPSSSVLPVAPLAIYRPGPGSHVTSPFQIVGRGGPSFDERVHIRLLGEDGRVISQQTTILFAYPGNAGNFSTRLAFDTPSVAESARLEISTDGVRWAKMDQLVSVDLVLLTEGSSRMHPVSHGPQKLAILGPRAGAVVQGGVMTVRGAGWADSDLPLQVELITLNGDVLAREEVRFDSMDPGVLGSFELEIPYEIRFSQYVRVAISEQDPDLPGLRHYSSVEVWLKP